MRATHNTDRNDGTEEGQQSATSEDPSVQAPLFLTGGLVVRLLLGVRFGSNL